MPGRWLVRTLALILVLAWAADVRAGTRVFVGIGGPPAFYYHHPHYSFGFFYAPAPVYVAPAPVYVVPAQPVYVVPGPASSAPIYVPPPASSGSTTTLPPPAPAPATGPAPAVPGK